ncbi:universal stress protein [Catenulispora subtropica]|uniref:Universal stress protein n=1 Tax=Catenulispora subtropica TaxID=450798 RepID=A0ABN2TGY1_9ACTN
MTRPVVVGIDDIEHSARAVAAGAREARLRGAPLWLAHAYHWIPPVVAGVMPGGDTPEGAVRDAATALLAQAVARTHAEFPDLDIHDYAMSGHPGPCLADLAQDAALLVVGGRGRGGFTGLLLGSTALSTVAHTRCPVLVVRGGPDTETGTETGTETEIDIETEAPSDPPATTNRVLVGADVLPPATGPDVISFAFEEAALHASDLRAVHAWEDPGYLYPVAIGGYPSVTLDQLNAECQRRLDALLDPWREKYPDTYVETQVLAGPPSKLLVDSTRTADLLVIGALRHPSGKGVHLGGLGHALLHHSQCPVVIVPEG